MLMTLLKMICSSEASWPMSIKISLQAVLIKGKLSEQGIHQVDLHQLFKRLWPALNISKNSLT